MGFMKKIFYLVSILIFSCRYERDFYQSEDVYSDLLKIDIVSSKNGKKIGIKNIESDLLRCKISSEKKNEPRINVAIDPNYLSDSLNEKLVNLKILTQENITINLEFKYSTKYILTFGSDMIPIVTISSYKYKLGDHEWKEKTGSFILNNLNSDDKEDIKIII